MTDTYLLKTKKAERLYRDYAEDAPIIDFHNHLSVSDIANDKKYDNLYELWLASDPYKHRLMRISGVDEHFITGDASPIEKFRKFAAVFPTLWKQRFRSAKGLRSFLLWTRVKKCAFRRITPARSTASE